MGSETAAAVLYLFKMHLMRSHSIIVDLWIDAGVRREVRDEFADQQTPTPTQTTTTNIAFGCKIVEVSKPGVATPFSVGTSCGGRVAVAATAGTFCRTLYYWADDAVPKFDLQPARIYGRL